MREEYPRLAARTRGFTLGRPRSFRVAPDGGHVLFLRSSSGTDSVQSLWRLDLAIGEERLLVDAAELVVDDEDLPSEERARRERAREQAAGIVRYTTDHAVRRAAFTVGGGLWLVDVDGSVAPDPETGATAAGARRLDVDGPVVDPQLSPDGRQVAWVRAGSLRVTDVETAATHTLVGEDREDVTWGLAEFVAAEEMGRTRGYWWSPDGDRLLVSRVDVAPVQRWFIANPVAPDQQPVETAYPAAGTPNADVGLHLVSLDGTRREVRWDREALPYLAAVAWEAAGAPLLTVQSRDQQRLCHLAVDVDGGSDGPVATRVLADIRDDHWVELVDGVPAWQRNRLVTVVQDAEHDVRRVAVDGRAVGPADLHVREVLAVTDDEVLVRASREDPAVIDVWRISPDTGTAERVSAPDGVTSAVAGDGGAVLQRGDLDSEQLTTTATSAGTTWAVRDLSATSPVVPRVRLLRLGPRGLRAALLRPHGVPDDEPLPVLLDPYGGPHGQRVLASRGAFRTSQWFAERGLAVLVIDGRGTPGRGLTWEQAVDRDLSECVLQDQVDGLQAAAEESALDLDRVAIRGWSFGGYLAALAVLRRPDVFAAAIAGAPVTEWRLYDTHYTERYLGDPGADAEVYERNSLLPLAGRLERPLLLVHGLADDNVVVAHTLRLSQALLEAGRPHQVLPLSGVTHMTPQEVVAENLMNLQARFLEDALGV